LTEPHPQGSVGEPPEPSGSGRIFSHRALAGAKGQEGAKNRVQAFVDREPVALASP
jgi:hypothetical protein